MTDYASYYPENSIVPLIDFAKAVFDEADGGVEEALDRITGELRKYHFELLTEEKVSRQVTDDGESLVLIVRHTPLKSLKEFYTGWTEPLIEANSFEELDKITAGSYIWKVHYDLYMQTRNEGSNDDQKVSGNIIEAGPEKWICCDLLEDRWDCDPYDVIEAIQNRGLRVETSFGDTPLLPDTLGDFVVHRKTLLKFEAANDEYVRSLSVITPPSPHKAHNLPEPVCPNPSMENAEASPQREKRPTVTKDYTERMPEIVGTVLAIKDAWDKAGKDSPIRKHGFVESEIEGLAGEHGSPRKMYRAIKNVLPKFDIKVWQGKGARPTS